jgi:hypothetical protein
VLGTAGWLLELERIPAWVLVVTVAVASYVTWRKRNTGQFGLQRQVRRRWPRGTPAWLAFALWGATLGFGLLTAIPYTSWLLVFGAELVSGPALGALAGALLGAGRQGVLLIAAARDRDPVWLMSLLPPRLGILASTVNLTLILAGGALLAVGSLG